MVAKLRDRDVSIEITIDDLFSVEGSIVVGSNTTFDTDLSGDLISKKSVQGQFTQRYYGCTAQLDAELEAALRNQPCDALDDNRIGKKRRYEIGTVVRVSPKDRTGYFLAIANINEHGVASGTYGDLQLALSRLWLFVGQRGQKGALVMPVLGSGFARLTQPRQVIIQETIKSFVAACSEKTFCDKLAIVMREDDVINNGVDFDELGNYLRHVCKYTEFAVHNGGRTGTPVT
ncbi:MAG: macro domain-containing protein [Candidatus Cryosericum sp.]